MSSDRSNPVVCAILALRKDAAFSIVDQDLSTLVWLDEKQSRPTDDEIRAQIEASSK